ncbi:MAG: nicotinate (nicotinamide) nucleotide adenylyltransferase [Treponema sp.]|nr:nicotinate (nicotinamide) nucleotide adenylyltransferase [Treponema sp.]
MQRRFAILGGSFNPPHLGHLFLAEAVLSELAYDRIILIPAYESPFKQGAGGAAPRDRLDMLAASIPGDVRLTIDDTEIRREGVSYTIDTVKDIIERYRPADKPGLILGDDLAGDFPRWKGAGAIAGLADIIIARRFSGKTVPFPYPCRELHNEIINISSGMVRDRIRQGLSWRYLVAEGARIIIEDRGLYGLNPGGEAAGLSDTGAWNLLVAVEKAVHRMVSPSRFFHSRGCALLSWDLCRRFGLDPRAGYLAGLAHDMGKAFSEKELLELAGKDGEGFSKTERERPSLLHGRAAAVLLQDRFGIHNEDILEAVRRHTTGRENMGPLAKVVYIADKIEVSRRDLDPRFRVLPEAGLDQLFAMVLDDTVAFLHSRKTELSGETRRLLDTIHKRRTE